MFEWLSDEIARIKTRKFHLVHGPPEAQLRELIEQSIVPPSYKAFVIQFGNAKLYRQGGSYLVQVLGAPRETSMESGEELVQFGWTDSSEAFFKKKLLFRGNESPVFEWQHGTGVRKWADDFEEWLLRKCRTARASFKKQRWMEIEAGPLPFSEQEKATIAARRNFRWRMIGVAQNGDLLFEVQNASNLVLPYLSIGVRGKNGKLNGGIWLPVSSVLPGETRIIPKDCYKDLLDPQDVEVFEKPSPEPEDRDRYWEFKPIVKD